MSLTVPSMCQPRKTMHRSVVSHVNSIYQTTISKCIIPRVEEGRQSYVHVALGAVVHTGHAVVHAGHAVIAVIHVCVVHVVVFKV